MSHYAISYCIIPVFLAQLGYGSTNKGLSAASHSWGSHGFMECLRSQIATEASSEDQLKRQAQPT